MLFRSEYDRYMKDLEDAGDDEADSAPKQILATLAAMGGSGNSEDTPPDAGIPAPEEPPASPRTNIRPVDQLIARNLGDVPEEETAAEAILRTHGVEEGERIVYGETLTEPITPAELTDPEALEAKRIKLFEAAKELQNLNSKLKKAHADADKEYEETLQIGRAHV